MPVATETAYAERVWTGVETSINPGFSAESEAHVYISYVTALGVLTPLTRGTHFNVTLDADDAVTVQPLALPTPPVTLLISRQTPALQEVDFENLEDFDAATHTRLADRSARRDAELRDQLNRRVAPFFTASGVVNFSPYRLAGADPINDNEYATRGYVLEITGILSLQGFVDAAALSAASAALSATTSGTAKTGAETARDRAQLWAEQTEDTPVDPGLFSAHHWANKASAAAAIVLPYLTLTDDGLFGDPDTGSIDDGAFL